MWEGNVSTGLGHRRVNLSTCHSRRATRSAHGLVLADIPMDHQFNESSYDVALLHDKRREPKTPLGRFCVGLFFPCTVCCYRSNPKTSAKGGVLLCFTILLFLLGALFFWGVEGSAECRANGVPFPSGIRKWSYASSVYFCFVTASTIGYGECVVAILSGSLCSRRHKLCAVHARRQSVSHLLGHSEHGVVSGVRGLLHQR